MKKYEIVFLRADALGAAYKIVFPKFYIYIIFLLFFFVYAVIGFNFYRFKTLNAEIKEISEYIPSHYIHITKAMPYINQLNEAVVRIGESDIYVDDMFDYYCVNNFFDRKKYTESYLDSSKLLSLLHYDIKNEVDTSHLKRSAALISAEYDKRLANSQKMFYHLQEQYIVLAHTPSIWPTTERITSHFGFRKSPFTGVPSFHEGTDFGAITGTPVRSTADGVVVFAGTRTGYGYLVTVDHGFGYMTRYAHNSKLNVKAGDFVKKGDLIALSGSTGRSAGPHLHYEVLYNGTPVNSMKYLPNEGKK